MPGLQAQNVVVAGTGAVYVAPEGTAMPVDLADPVAPFVNMGYCSEDGVTFTISREQEDIPAWQSLEPVRVLVTSEPKVIAFELLEFDTESLLLALRGGTVAGTTVKTYTPPDPGAQDVRAMVIDGIDGDYSFRFCFPRVALQGDVEWSLVRSDAIRLPLEFQALASATKWTILSDHPGLAVPVAMTAMPTTHAGLDEAAEQMGVEFTSGATVAEKQSQLEAAGFAVEPEPVAA
jgi:hypothetical protein